MSLLFEHTWEHALVAAVVEQAKRSCPECYLGRTAIQKLVYFLQVLEVPMSFNFRIHHFGPYCDDLVSTLDWLQADNIVEDKSNQPKYSDFATDSNWDELKGCYSDRLEQHQPTIETIVSAMGSMDPSTLELIATLHFSFRWVHARGKPGPWKAESIARFKQIKDNKFADSEIDRWYDILVSAELVNA